jgi:hypothetical protein
MATGAPDRKRRPSVRLYNSDDVTDMSETDGRGTSDQELVEQRTKRSANHTEYGRYVHTY